MVMASLERILRYVVIDKITGQVMAGFATKSVADKWRTHLYHETGREYKVHDTGRRSN